MPLIPAVGNRSYFYRCLLAAVYAALLLGSIPIIGPFWIMLVKSVSSEADIDTNQFWPRYLSDERYVIAKYEGELRGRVEDVRAAWQLPPSTDGWKGFHPAMPDFEHDAVLLRHGLAMRGDWQEFCRHLTLSDEGIAFTVFAPFAEGTRAWEGFLTQRYGSMAHAADVHGFAADATPPYLNEVFPRRLIADVDAAVQDARDFRRSLAASGDPLLNQVSVRWFDGEFRAFLRGKYGDSAHLRSAWSDALINLEAAEFHDSPPKPAAPRADWIEFVKTTVPATLIQLNAEQAGAYRTFLTTRYPSVEKYNQLHQRGVVSFAEAPFSERFPIDADAQTDWMDFLNSLRSPEAFRVRTADSMRSEWLAVRYHGSIDALNNEWGAHFSDFRSARFDAPLIDSLYVHEHLAELRLRYFGGNYASVFSFLVTKGDAALNTLILIGLSLIATFTVNPIAAYALARFRLSGERKILVFLIATMAFPAEVAMIPSFMLIKMTGLLNTYWALVLPGLANGMAILLLKGFFDSLPSELFEAAAMDGASEFRIFWQVALPLSSPIMAVNALGAFVSAYTAWSWALLICQEPSMWTIMVHLFQFQVTSHSQGQVFASLVIGSIPTLLVFIFCQRLIMRGIVLPSMK